MIIITERLRMLRIFRSMFKRLHILIIKYYINMGAGGVARNFLWRESKTLLYCTIIERHKSLPIVIQTIKLFFTMISSINNNNSND